MVFTLNSLKVKDFIISGYVVFLIAPAHRQPIASPWPGSLRQPIAHHLDHTYPN